MKLKLIENPIKTAMHKSELEKHINPKLLHTYSISHNFFTYVNFTRFIMRTTNKNIRQLMVD